MVDMSNWCQCIKASFISLDAWHSEACSVECCVKNPDHLLSSLNNSKMDWDILALPLIEVLVFVSFAGSYMEISYSVLTNEKWQHFAFHNVLWQIFSACGKVEFFGILDFFGKMPNFVPLAKILDLHRHLGY